MLELRKQRTARVGKVLERLAVKSQDRVIPRDTTPLEDFMERSELVGSQAQELSALPVQDEPKCGRELPRRSRLIAHLAILYALSARWRSLIPRAHITHALVR